MIMLQWTATGMPKNELIVRDVNLLNYCEENAHWNNTSKCIFGAADGLFASERMYLVMLQPWAVSAPHSHGQGTEEVWTKVTPGDATMMLGSELREMPQNAAYLVPPTGFTKHANLNMEPKIAWSGGSMSPADPPSRTAETAVAAGAEVAEGRPIQISLATSPRPPSPVRRSSKQGPNVRSISKFGICLLMVGAVAQSQKDWPTYGHDGTSARYSPLKQI